MNIKTYRQREGMTLAALARACKVTTATVWHWERGRVPRRSRWPKIEKATRGAVRKRDWVKMERRLLQEVIDDV